jgi:UDP-N-acetylmuramoyl-tripeptide--D-alanyl-D-alanine ligase
MVELGSRQKQENARFAADAGRMATELVLVGRTNRRALLRGAHESGIDDRTVVVDTREEAVAWVRHHLGEGDVVLFENDLPDHYP